MILLPGLRQLYMETGIKPVVLVSSDYASTLDGCSYVEPWAEDLNWWLDLALANRMATQRYGWHITPKFWDDPNHIKPPVHPDKLAYGTPEYNASLCIPIPEPASYMLDQWRAAGFRDRDLGRWPLVFDRRNKEREAALVRCHLIGRGPFILTNLTGQSSSFAWAAEAAQTVARFRSEYKIIDLSAIHCHRIYDLLALMEKAAVLVTADTSTLHLASACKIPIISFIADHNNGSIVTGNHRLSLRYHEAQRRMPELYESLALL